MRATLRNLEKYEAIANSAFVEGVKLGATLREAVYVIKSERLWEAVESDDIHNFETYLASSRLKLEYDKGRRLALTGEIEQEMEKQTMVCFSDRAIRACHTIREEVAGHKTHKLDIPKIKRVLRKAESLAKQEKTKPTERHVREAKDLVLNAKTKSLEKVLEDRISTARRLLRSFEELHEMSEEVFADVNIQSAGVVKRLAAAYSDVASFLRKVI